jgi:hypothetical protein
MIVVLKIWAWIQSHPVFDNATIVMIIAELQLLALKYKSNSLVTVLINYFIKLLAS